MSNRYLSEEYLSANPDWHESDSHWKAQLVKKMFDQNNFLPKHVCEIGCGTGLVLATLQTLFQPTIQFEGFDISPHAIERAQKRTNEHLTFSCQDIIKTKTVNCDVILLLDVIEHVENCFEFLRTIKSMSGYALLHIPLDLSVQSVARVKPILKQRTVVGHIHYFTKETAFALLEDVGYEVVDWFYTGAAAHGSAQTLLSRLARLPRKVLFSINQDFTVRWLGGYSLMVLVK